MAVDLRRTLVSVRTVSLLITVLALTKGQLGQIMTRPKREPVLEVPPEPTMPTILVANGSLIANSKNCTNDTAIIARLLEGTGYNKHRVPGGNGVAVVVEFWIQEITSISEITNDFEMDIYINELWLDPALNFETFTPCKQNLSLNYQLLDRLWTPNTCFVNSKVADIHDSPFKNVFLMLYPNGVKVRGPCNMDLSRFPMDTQSCSLIYESFNYNNFDVQLRWSPIPEPVYKLKDIRLPDFDLIQIAAWKVTTVYPAGLWDELHIKLTFERRYVWYFLQAYVPTYLTIFISWVSFTLGARAIPARTMLGVNALLAMMFQFGNIMRNLPRVSYVKAIDVWMLVSMTFIFCSLLELAVVGYMVKDDFTSGMGQRRRSSQALLKHCLKQHHAPTGFSSIATSALHSPTRASRRHRSAADLGVSGSSTPVSRRPIGSTLKEERYLFDINRYESKSNVRGTPGRVGHCCRVVCPVWTPDKIDRAAGIAFPALFSIFNIVYWSYYGLNWSTMT